MKRTLGSLIAIDRKGFLLLALLAGFAVFGLVSSRIDAQSQEKIPTSDPPAGSDAPATVFPGIGLPAQIPDSPAGGTLCGDYTGAPLNITFNVSGMTAPLTDVRVDFTSAGLTHSWVGDLDVTLRAPGDAAVKTIFKQTLAAAATDCGDDSDVSGPYNFFDTAPAAPTWWNAATAAGSAVPVAPGDYRATTPGGAAGGGVVTAITPAFAGLTTGQINGTWTLRVHDGGQGDTGAISAANLTLVGSGPPAVPGPIIISEFRVRGPSGANDEFIEMFNRGLGPHTVAAASGTGYGVAASDGVTRCSIPNGTVIPGGGHYLCTNSVAYSLGAYATGDATYTTDIPDNAGIALFNNNVPANYTLANRLDAVGSTSEANTTYKEGTGYPALTPFSIDYSFYRLSSGMATAGIADPTFPNTSFGVDTNNNANDFVFVDTNGTSAGAGQRLGAPGPENLSSPLVHLTGFTRNRIDSTVVGNSPPNSVRDFTSVPAQNSTFGTLSVRRRFVNNTGGSITTLRFRVLKLTTFPAPSGTADLRTRTSGSVVVGGVNDAATCAATGAPSTPPCTVTVQGTTLEQPPSQPNGGAFNGTFSAGTVTLGTPLANGASINLQFLFGIQQTGVVRGSMAIEALPRGGGLWSFQGDTDAGILGVTDLNSPTAASVSIGGRVLTADGRGLTNARVTITGPDGVARTTITSSFGYYSFDGVESGATYVVAVGSKRFTFAPRVVQVVDNLSDLDFVAEP